MSKSKPELPNLRRTTTYDREQILQSAKRNKISFATLMDPDLLEKLRAMSFWTKMSQAEIVNQALTQFIEQSEQERGEPFQVLPPHKIKSS